jgi:hypothetical protein
MLSATIRFDVGQPVELPQQTRVLLPKGRVWRPQMLTAQAAVAAYGAMSGEQKMAVEAIRQLPWSHFRPSTD